MSALKNNPLALAVLGVAAWYMLTQNKARAGTIGNPQYGQQGALVAPGQQAYLVPASRLVPGVGVVGGAPAPSTAQSVLGIVSQLLGRSGSSAPAPAVSGSAPGYSLIPAGWSWGQSTINPANVLTGLPTVSTNATGQFEWGGPLVSSSPLTGIYSDNDGTGVIDGWIGSVSPTWDFSAQQVDADPYGYF